MALTATVAGISGCSDKGEPDAAAPTDMTVDTAAAHVALTFTVGSRTSSCAGVLVAPSAVLTAAHCAAGKTRAQIVAPRAHGQKATSSSFVFYDWTPDGDGAQPDHHDVALVLLDQAIAIDGGYPTVSRTHLRDGTPAIHVRRAMSTDGKKSGKFLGLRTELFGAKTSGLPHAYRTFADPMAVDTGGPAYDADHQSIVGVVSGVGHSTGALFITRTDGLGAWVASNVSKPAQAYVNPPPGADAGAGAGAGAGGYGYGPMDAGTDAARPPPYNGGTPPGGGGGGNNGVGGGVPVGNGGGIFGLPTSNSNGVPPTSTSNSVGDDDDDSTTVFNSSCACGDETDTAFDFGDDIPIDSSDDYGGGGCGCY